MASACYDQAERRLRVEVKSDPGNPRLWFGLSQASLMLGKAAEAEAAAREGVRLSPKSGEGYFHLAKALIAVGKPAEALKAAREGLAAEPGNLSLRDLEATALTHSGDLVSAEAIYGELVRKEPENPVWLVKRSRALLGLDRFGESRDALDSAMSKARSLAEQDVARIDVLETVMQMAEEIDGLLVQKGLPTKLPAWVAPKVKGAEEEDDHHRPPGGEPGGGGPGGPGRGPGGEGGGRM
jgi:predicted Zn-dependent protease